MAVWSGGANVQRQLRDAGLAAETLASVERARSAAVKAANDSSTPGALRVSGHALKTVEVLLTSARYALAGGGGNVGPAGADDFRLAVQKRFDEPPPGAAEARSVSSDETLLRDGGVSFDAAKVTLSLWALNPALAFADIAGARDERGTNSLARSVVLTSGTLAPLDSFASELGAHVSDPHGGAALRGRADAGVVRRGGRGRERHAPQRHVQDLRGVFVPGRPRGLAREVVPRDPAWRAGVFPQLLAAGPRRAAMEEHGRLAPPRAGHGEEAVPGAQGAAEAEAAGEAKAGAAAGAEAARKTPSTRFCPSITARCG